jgi:hypothetical protein
LARLTRVGCTCAACTRARAPLAPQVNYTVRVAGEYEMSISFSAAAGGGTLPGSPYILTVHPAKASVRPLPPLYLPYAPRDATMQQPAASTRSLTPSPSPPECHMNGII